MKIKCHYCKSKFEASTGAYNRAVKKGLNVYCNKTCSGLGRRHNKTTEQKKLEKAEYDRQFREKNAEKIKKEKATWFQRTYNPVQATIERKAKYPKHLEYIRTPEYRKWKKEYDKKYRTQKEYGEFGEAFLILQELENELDTRSMKYEWRLTNKAQIRKRKWQQLRN